MNKPESKFSAKVEQSVQYLKAVGPKRAASFNKIGIKTIRDLLFYFPSRHLDRTTVLTFAKAYSYVSNGYSGELTIIAKVAGVEKIRYAKKELLKVQFRDSTGFFECIWFQGIKYFQSVFNEGDTFAISSKPTISRYGKFQFTHPDFDRISEEESFNLLNTGKIIPFYRLAKELRAVNLGDLSLRKIISGAVENYSQYLEETLPDEIITTNNLLSIVDTVRNYHFPQSKAKLDQAIQRLKFEELFYLELLVALRSHNHKSKLKGTRMKINTNLVSDFLKVLPFELTKSQLKVLSEIKLDMLSDKPMNRLLQGDVGSGKTIVALIAMLITVDNGLQSALMVPTEILADQHARTISDYMNKLYEIHKTRKIKVALLIGGQKKSLKEKNREEIEMQEADIIVGTHALLEENVKFKKLGLVVIDEQHRFGVAQRAKVISKGYSPDVIVMSATPIPRTITMTLYGDLEVSVINELPQNRKPVRTFLRGEKDLPNIFKFIVDKCKEGNQAFIIYPLVEESEKLELKAALSHYEELKSGALKEISLGLIHGRMGWQEKQATMLMFKEKKYDALVATTVIEVGIDIPDANIVLVNDAHRFGLSQLHQLRGRVGRGGKQAYCVLVTKDFLISSSNKFDFENEYLSLTQIENLKSSFRLQAMVKHSDGFKLSEVDLKLRGPGDIFGTMQSGFPELKHADLVNDIELISTAKKTAFELIKNDPTLSHSSNQLIKKILINNYLDNLNYAKIG
ncbi:MAG: ATP-dependent DNA helicase RecG [Ignavibacteriaceae bacterium]|nr:ATP-dependent DNA helicase RecG [Ignavibacteriaceae bacterium]